MSPPPPVEGDRIGTAPAVSVCVATYSRAAQLRRLLDHLSRLESPPGGFEVVVVDDGSPVRQGVAETLERAAPAFPVALRWRTLPQNTGRAGARNAAWRMAFGEWVAFTDDDCRPEPGWLVALMGTATSEPSPDIVQGRTIPDPDRESLLVNPLARSLRVENFSNYFETANIAYRKEVLERIGGFDETLPGAGEDTELGWRARACGSTVAFAPDALVVHDVAVRTFRQDLADRRRWGDLVRVIKLQPETRLMAWRPYIYRRSHVGPLVLVSCLPLMLAGRRGRLLFATVALGGFGREARSKTTLEAMIRHLQARVGDFYEVWVLLRSSIRNKTVLL